jgi:hypothetical protein
MQLAPLLSSVPAPLYASRTLVSLVAHAEEVLRQSLVQWVALGELRKDRELAWVECRRLVALQLVEQMDVEEEGVVVAFVAVAAAKARLLHRHLC